MANHSTHPAFIPIIHDHPPLAKAFFLSTWGKTMELDTMPCEGFTKKKHLKGFFDIFQNEDDYIQIPVIIKKVGEVD